jgi:Kdo2-lipid IVA lauroyltransferase/acyltransferase
MNKTDLASLRASRKRKKKGKVRQLLEYGVAASLLPLVRVTPPGIIHLMGDLFGNLLFLLMPARRRLAIENLNYALGAERTEDEIKRIARKSCQSFFLTCFEIIKFQDFFKKEDAREALKGLSEELEVLFQKARKIHEESGGCIFVTPHLGNWEYLPHVSSVLGIPLVVVVRPFSNAYLERLVYSSRADSGQVILPKKNVLFMLQKTLQQGKSIGLLPDQSTHEGINVDFFGRKASTTPGPALLSIMYKRPIVVVACCRKEDGSDFEGVVSDPIWPGTYESEKREIFRLTEAMNRKMEEIIRKYPEQYFWIHDRWKVRRSRKELLQ